MKLKKDEIIYSEDMIFYILMKYGDGLSASQIAKLAKKEFGESCYHISSFKRKLGKMKKDRLSFVKTSKAREPIKNRLTTMFSIKESAKQ